jgi:SEC-C motif domain protein
MRCPCRKKTETTTYADCCEVYHSGQAAAPTAEALMRSRYAAFSLENAPYLLATWHASTRPSHLNFVDGQVFQQLKVLAATTEGDRATVAFVARSRVGGTNHVLEEVSRFVREGGRWYYIDGLQA